MKKYTIKIEWNFEEENDDKAKDKVEEHIDRMSMNDIEDWISVENKLICDNKTEIEISKYKYNHCLENN